MNHDGDSNTSLESLNKQIFRQSTSEYEGRSSEHSEKKLGTTNQKDGDSNTSLQSLNNQYFRQSSSEYERRSSEHSEKKVMPAVQQESISSTENECVKVVREVQQESTFSTEKDGINVIPQVQQESISSTENECVKVDGAGQQESISNSKIDSKKITHSKEVAECCHPLKIVVKVEAEDRLQRPYYNTTGRRGLLFIIQNEDPLWEAGNKKDESVLREYFENTLNFNVAKYRHYSKVVSDLKGHLKAQDTNSNLYYCLLIFISAHGNEEGIHTDLGMRKNHEITNDFSNEEMKELCGVPKIFILDACRGTQTDQTVKSHADVSLSENRQVMPTKSSDYLIIHATTHGYVARIPETGSVGLQGVMEVLKMNWQTDHLEEMLIDARPKVASKEVKGFRQILEIQTTLLKRLKFR